MKPPAGVLQAFPKDLRRKVKRTRTTRDGRLILSPADWQKMKRELFEGKKFRGQNGALICQICKLAIWHFDDIETDHINPRGMGGGKRDDRPENIQPAHRWCNREKGSKRI